jgi:hypothetical protein
MSAVKMRTQGLGRFMDYDKSGAVSLRASEFLRSDEGKKQLEHARELRTGETSQKAATTSDDPKTP